MDSEVVDLLRGILDELQGMHETMSDGFENINKEIARMRRDLESR